MIREGGINFHDKFKWRKNFCTHQSSCVQICSGHAWFMPCLLALLFTVSAFPGGSDGQESACNAGRLGLTPGSGRSPGEGNGYPLQ